MMCIQNLVLFCQFFLKILSKNQILTSIKGRNSVSNLRKNKDLQTKFGLILSIRFQDIEQKQILTSIKDRNSVANLRNFVANLRKPMIYITNVDLVNDYVYTKFGLNRSIRFQDIGQKLNSHVNQGP